MLKNNLEFRIKPIKFIQMTKAKNLIKIHREGNRAHLELNNSIIYEEIQE